MSLVYIHKDLRLFRWRSWERAVRFVGVWGAFGVLTLFYLIPIIAIQGLINIDQLRKIHVIAVIIDLPVVRSIITAILPGTVLRPFWAIQAAVPPIQSLSCSMADSGLQNSHHCSTAFRVAASANLYSSAGIVLPVFMNYQMQLVMRAGQLNSP